MSLVSVYKSKIRLSLSILEGHTYNVYSSTNRNNLSPSDSCATRSAVIGKLGELTFIFLFQRALGSCNPSYHLYVNSGDRLKLDQEWNFEAFAIRFLDLRSSSVTVLRRRGGSRWGIATLLFLEMAVAPGSTAGEGTISAMKTWLKVILITRR